ncbi:MAG TPA: hypothetical protein VGE74_05255 [Gemmata sp.]
MRELKIDTLCAGLDLMSPRKNRAIVEPQFRELLHLRSGALAQREEMSFVRRCGLFSLLEYGISLVVI